MGSGQHGGAIVNASVADLTGQQDSPYRLTRTGLVAIGRWSREEWRRVGLRITAFSSAVAWAIGDWLNYGEGLGEHGEIYKDAAAITGRSYESLGQYARVSRTFALGDRDPRVPWAHYRLILPLPPAKQATAIAETVKRRWTQHDLQVWMHGGAVGSVPATRHTRGVSKWRPPEVQQKGRRVACPQCGHQFNIPRNR
jgi:hypothetical protein